MQFGSICTLHTKTLITVSALVGDINLEFDTTVGLCVAVIARSNFYYRSDDRAHMLADLLQHLM